MKTHKGLPVHGYQPQSDLVVAVVNVNKQMEESLLRRLDGLSAAGSCDQHWLDEARRLLELGFMALNRAVFQPERIKLPEDDT